ncbi:Alginate O-acetylase AlgJ precursor [Actinidia chinensis var. chinensis]|uniref:Alginate O-acetylase AlgJ n=1 Tax=Actinidia chinensis var. chinensis TaxID=1590841 RepID=A0A2R6P937_ACTCC|nr:Alginate O-acetylase AlgJ precursor [Actinidia chinensis var. chinensis]
MVMDVENRDPLGFPQWSPIRRRFGPDAPFFASGNIERELLAKQIYLSFFHVKRVVAARSYSGGGKLLAVALDITEDEKQQLEIVKMWKTVLMPG